MPEHRPYTVNPDWWVPQGYVVIRVDGRSTGKSPGSVRRLSDEEARDFYDAVEWPAAQR
jgi:predicted acyl esterase